MSPNRTSFYVMGTEGSPVTIGPGSTESCEPLTLGSETGIVSKAFFKVQVVVGSPPPTVNPILTFRYSLDSLPTWWLDPCFVCKVPLAPGVYDYDYDVPNLAIQMAEFVISNPDSVASVTGLGQACTTTISIP